MLPVLLMILVLLILLCMFVYSSSKLSGVVGKQCDESWRDSSL